MELLPIGFAYRMKNVEGQDVYFNYYWLEANLPRFF